MANPIEIHVTDRPADKFADERRSRLGGDLADWNPYQTSHKAPVKAEWKTGVYETVAGREGTSRVHMKETAYASGGLRPGHIIIHGRETTIEAARLAGFDVSAAQEGEQRRPFAAPNHPAARRDTAFPTIQVGGTGADEYQPLQHPDAASQKPHSAAQESTSEQPDDGAGLTPQETADAASEAIQAIERSHGAHVVDDGLDEVSDSGYLPDEDQLPQGVSMAAVEKIVAGYTAVANDTLQGVGASVDMLMETLSDAELREARQATITGDSAKLQHLGARAVTTLAMLPTSDPEAFAEMVEGMRPQERKALSQADNGDWVVTVPGRPAMSFAAAVKAGIVRV